MKRRIESALEKIAETLGAWENVDTITVIESGEDIYDPYFFLSLDVYFRGGIPEFSRREKDFDYVIAFESSKVNRKDRFLVDDVPVRLEYKSIERFNQIIDGGTYVTAFRDTGTYMFYRIQSSRVLNKKSDWIETAREKLTSFSPEFWESLRIAFQSRMEHYLSDLSAAVIRNDQFFYLSSAAGFIRSLCSVLFAINRRFEPSGRIMTQEVLALPLLPEPFEGRFLSFLREDAELSLERKREIANLMAKGIINLG